jgi:hypothetical protein
MFRSFIAWLDSYLSREEPSSVLKAIVGLMAFAGLLGTIFGNQAVRATSTILRLTHRAKETDRRCPLPYGNKECSFNRTAT